MENNKQEQLPGYDLKLIHSKDLLQLKKVYKYGSKLFPQSIYPSLSVPSCRCTWQKQKYNLSGISFIREIRTATVVPRQAHGRWWKERECA